MHPNINKYKHIFFDLDRTIWDFDNNALETFQDIYKKYRLEQIFKSFDSFYNTYLKHNERLWEKYREGKLEKLVFSYKRFALTLEEFGVSNEILAKEIAHDYILINPTKKRLFPFAHEILYYLHKKYKLYIITNGFKEVQLSKLKNSNLDKYFSKVITSEEAGAQKPDPVIFNYALNVVNACKNESLMIGDDFKSDVLGAKRFGLDQVFFNPKKKNYKEGVTYEITSLKELQGLL